VNLDVRTSSTASPAAGSLAGDAAASTLAPPTAAGHELSSRGRLRTLFNTRVGRIALVVWLLLALAGAVGVAERLIGGHAGAGYGSYVPWGLWVAMYFHLIGLAGGCFVLAALGFIFRWRGFQRPAALRTGIILSVALVLPAFLGVWLDLGRLLSAYRIFTAPSFSSMMAFNAWMYTAFLVVAAAAFYLTFKPASGWLRPVLALGVVLSIAFPSQSGAFFGVVDAKPYWHSALLPFLFLTSAIVAGAALLLLVRALQGRYDFVAWDEGVSMEWRPAVDRLRVVVFAGVLLYLALEFAELSIGFWSPTADAPGLELMLWGPYWWVFWVVHLFIGAIVPLVLLSLRRPGLWMAAAGLVAVAFVSARLNILIPGQALSEIEGLNTAFFNERLVFDYNATLEEYLVALFLVAAAAVLFVAGAWATAALRDRVDRGGAS
jgi:protein NrfD